MYMDTHSFSVTLGKKWVNVMGERCYPSDNLDFGSDPYGSSRKVIGHIHLTVSSFIFLNIPGLLIFTF